MNILVCDKGKRKIVDHMEEEKSFKFWVDPLVEKVSMAIEEKRKQHDKRIVLRQREKPRMEETEKELQ